MNKEIIEMRIALEAVKSLAQKALNAADESVKLGAQGKIISFDAIKAVEKMEKRLAEIETRQEK